MVMQVILWHQLPKALLNTRKAKVNNESCARKKRITKQFLVAIYESKLSVKYLELTLGSKMTFFVQIKTMARKVAVGVSALMVYGSEVWVLKTVHGKCAQVQRRKTLRG